MTIFFAWEKGETTFNMTHCRHDIDILKLSIEQQENEFATVILQVPASSALPSSHEAYGILSFQPSDKEAARPLFSGWLVGLPKFVSQDVMEFELTARPDNFEQQLRDLAESLKKEESWDPLFYPSNSSQISDVLDARTQLFHWDRRTNKLSLSSILEGKETLDLGDNFFKDSFSLTVQQIPLKEIHVSLKAEWVQEADGMVNLAPMIARHFSRGVLNTLTPQSFAKKWKGMAYQLQGSGYTLKKAELEEIYPGYADVINYYSTASDPFFIKTTEGNPKASYIKRHWFKGEIVLYWLYRQKRREFICFSLKNSLPKCFEVVAAKRHIELGLQNICTNYHIKPWRWGETYDVNQLVTYDERFYICQKEHISSPHFSADEPYWRLVEDREIGSSFLDQLNAIGSPANASFFLTQRGKRAIKHAYLIAKAHLAASLRAVNVKFEAKFEDLLDLSLDHMVHLKNPTSPGADIKGKVIKYRLYIDGETGRRGGEVTLACCIGKDATGDQPSGPLLIYADKGIIADDYSSPNPVEILPGIIIQNYDDQAPIHGVTYPYQLNISQFVEELDIHNDGHVQNEVVKDKIFDTDQTPAKLLNQHHTNIRLKLKDLRAYEVLEHSINLTTLTSWSGPNHLALT